MKIEFTTKLIEKLREYCRVSAAGLNDDVLSRSYQFYAEEALSDLLLRWHRKNLNNGWKKKQMNDNFYFISCKNTVKNMIIREGRNKVKVHHDYNNLPLDETIFDDIEVELESDYKKDLEEVQDREDKMNGMLNSLVESLENSPYMQPHDTTVFVESFIEKKLIKDICKDHKLSYQKVKESRARIKNIINRDYNRDLN